MTMPDLLNEEEYGPELYIGIDPGLNGAIAFLWGRHAYVDLAPTVRTGTRRQLDARQMVTDIQRRLLPHCRPSAILESVHSMPRQGVASSFTFGRGFGTWEGILAALGIPYQLVTPQAWKKVMLRDTAKDKGAAMLVASRLWPQLGRLADGQAEALLIAQYGRLEASRMRPYREREERGQNS